jgi:hypothetical protein
MLKGFLWAAVLLALLALLAACEVVPNRIPARFAIATLAAIVTGASFVAGEKNEGALFVAGIAVIPVGVAVCFTTYATAIGDGTLIENIAAITTSEFAMVCAAIIGVCAIAARSGNVARNRQRGWHGYNLPGTLAR